MSPMITSGAMTSVTPTVTRKLCGSWLITISQGRWYIISRPASTVPPRK